MVPSGGSLYGTCYDKIIPWAYSFFSIFFKRIGESAPDSYDGVFPERTSSGRTGNAIRIVIIGRLYRALGGDLRLMVIQLFMRYALIRYFLLDRDYVCEVS